MKIYKKIMKVLEDVTKGVQQTTTVVVNKKNDIVIRPKNKIVSTLDVNNDCNVDIENIIIIG